MRPLLRRLLSTVGGGAVKNLWRERISDQVEVLGQLYDGQKPFESLFFHTVNLQKPQITAFFQILSHLAQKCFP